MTAECFSLIIIIRVITSASVCQDLWRYTNVLLLFFKLTSTKPQAGKLV